MTFQKFKWDNNARSQLAAGIWASALSMIVTTWEGALFPATWDFLLTLEQYDSNSEVVKREIVKATARSTDTFTIVRSQGVSVQDDTASPKTNWTTARSFDEDDYVSLYITEEQLDDIQDEITRIVDTDIADLETDKLDIVDFQKWTPVYNASSWWTDAYAIALTPAISVYTDWQTLQFRADVWNSWTATLNVNSVWAKTIKKEWVDEDLDTGDIEANQIVAVTWNSVEDVRQMQSNYGQVVQTTPESVTKSFQFWMYTGQWDVMRWWVADNPSTYWTDTDTTGSSWKNTITQIDTDKYAVVYQEGSKWYIAIITVVDWEPVFGAPVEFLWAAFDVASISKLDTDKWIIFYADNATTDLFARAFSVSWSTPTLWAELELHDAISTQFLDSCPIDTDKAIVCYNDSTLDWQVTVITTSWLVITDEW